MIGSEIHKFAKELWPINRSITGEGVRLTLERIKLHLPDLEIKSVPSGTFLISKSGQKTFNADYRECIKVLSKGLCETHLRY